MNFVLYHKVNGILVDVKIQICRQDDYHKRTLFYWAKSYIYGFQKGQIYQNLKNTIAVTLKDTHEIFSNKFSIYSLVLLN